MRENHWIEWTRTRLQPEKREGLLAALTLEQQAHLLDHDYVWVEGVGVLWKPPDGALRRARFTHGAGFQTQHGEFYIDSEGNARELSARRTEPPAAPARPPSLIVGDTMRDVGPAGVPTPPSAREMDRSRGVVGAPHARAT